MSNYSPIGSFRTNRTKEGGGGDSRDPRDREKPEVPGQPVVTPPTTPIEAPPEVPGPGGGGGGPALPAPTMPAMGTGNPFLQPGNVAAGAPFRTPAFFTNRYAGGFQETPARIGAGASLTSAGQPAKPPIDEQTLRALVAQFGPVR